MPKLVARQLRIVLPGIFKLLKTLAPILGTLQAAQGDNRAVLEGLMGLDLTEETMDLFFLVVWTSLTRGSPSITKEQFEGMEISLPELFGSFPKILEAAGLVQDTPDKAKEPAQMGEALTPTASTGTAS